MQTEAALPQLLIVEDDVVLLEFYGELLQPLCDIHISTDIQSAISLLQNQCIHLMLCDYKLANGNILELLPWLQEYRPELMQRMLVLTGLVQPGLEDLELKVLTKPVDANVLYELVENLCQQVEQEGLCLPVA